MKDADFQCIKDQKNDQPAKAALNAGVAIGSDLYSEFKVLGLLMIEMFIWLGVSHSQLFSDRVQTYRRTHFVHEDFILWSAEFQVGMKGI
jgi:hypothetical protein